MRRIGISQRIDAYPDRDERRDALDQRWAELLWQCDILAMPLNSLCPDNTAYLDLLALDGYILSGGNDIGQAPERDALEAAVLDHAVQNGLPVLGVCRGMQFMNHHAGGQLRPVRGHVAQMHPITGPFADDYGLSTVNSYHGLGMVDADMGTGLNATAHSADGIVEAFAHHNLPWLGIMWHPERNTPYDPQDARIIQSHFRVNS
ncbi:glutamine amidotransferase (plasmid) [Pseudohalocynthiibacter aestuariivivens]|uniref:Gamma-glutamyl-gamma-aminobutyrate hydrolase family protein n=1 Tax=Roseovarius pelagicus TaxID=2980108 RepID=A0ABY6D5H1_9RHOB|nr:MULTISPECIES: gamma-glutamyl-gamma-aminobutyrate hydrolase family protein [Rhodobacterales]QIE47904.1 glutamine amidotransferase [Pseudohalocynthiibacter aestuariivivens]UXX81397.1 gamma-glutamyl-gamma-aminobutyrate hydrolase family protein [Roseovarius pelagicus]